MEELKELSAIDAGASPGLSSPKPSGPGTPQEIGLQPQIGIRIMLVRLAACQVSKVAPVTDNSH